MELTYLIPVTASCPEACGLVPSEAVQILQEVMEYGRRRGKDGWWKIAHREHSLHAYYHLLRALYNHNAGTPPLVPDAAPPERHVEHAFCRLMMALMVEWGYEPQPYEGMKLSELADMNIEVGIIHESVPGIHGEKIDVSRYGDSDDHQTDLPEREAVPDQSGADTDEESERAGVAGNR